MHRYFTPIAIVVTVGATLLTPRDARLLDPGSWLTNGGFDSNVQQWEPEFTIPGVAFEWSSADRVSSPSSGSARLAVDAAGVYHIGATQCRPVPFGATMVTVSGSISYPADLGDSSASVAALFYDGPGCTGDFLDLVSDAVHEPQAGWVGFSESGTVPPGAVSVLTRLGLNKTEAGAALAANFDTVTLTFDQMPTYSVFVPGVSRD